MSKYWKEVSFGEGDTVGYLHSLLWLTGDVPLSDDANADVKTDIVVSSKAAEKRLRGDMVLPEEVEVRIAKALDRARPGGYLMQFFECDHLSPRLRKVSVGFKELAHGVIDLPWSPLRTEALRKLLEAKDCAVRAVLFK